MQSTNPQETITEDKNNNTDLSQKIITPLQICK